MEEGPRRAWLEFGQGDSLGHRIVGAENQQKRGDDGDDGV